MNPATIGQNALPDLAPAIRESEFVGRVGSVLTLAGKPFRFYGNNVYFNQADIVYGRAAAVEETLDKMVALGMTVARCNAHNDHEPSRDPAAIQLEPGVYSEAALVALDRSIAMAKARNIRLILKLTNNWEAYGGIRRYVHWHLGRTPLARESGLFYTEPRIKDWFRNYSRMIFDRRNTITGVTYRDEPAILAWELGNELRNPGGAGALLAWTAEMAAYWKQLDAHHLVADGGEGFDDAPALYPGLGNRYAVAGAEGCSYHRLALIPELDMLSYHLYPSEWGLNDGTGAAIYIRRHEEIARQAGKVAYLGEFGRKELDAARAAAFQSWFRIGAVEQGASGLMLWHLVNDGKTDAEGYQVYCPKDAESCSVLRRAADGLASSPVVTSAASLRPVTVAAGSLVTIFGADLLGTWLQPLAAPPPQVNLPRPESNPPAAGAHHDGPPLQFGLRRPEAIPPDARVETFRDPVRTQDMASSPINAAGPHAHAGAVDTPAMTLLRINSLQSVAVPPGAWLEALHNTGIPHDVPCSLAPPSQMNSGVEVRILDGAGGSHDATLLFAGPSQINILLPESVPPGAAVVRVMNSGAIRAGAAVMVAAVEPGLFHAGTATWDAPGGARTEAPIARFDPEQNTIVPVPLAIPPGASLILTLYGTGIRGFRSIEDVTAKAGGVPAEILFAGPQGQYPGLDQVNIRLSSHTGAGEIDVELTVNGKAANHVRVLVR